ncbi:MAG: acetyl-CoA hydrolase, partial [Halanaerobiales bacterium]
MLENRIRNKKYMKKIIKASEAAEMIKDGMTIGCSGFTPSGYPKAIPLALSNQNRDINISLLSGASVGRELDGKLSEKGMLKRRFPYQSDEKLREGINKGLINYYDIHLSHFPQQVRYGYYGDIDLAIVEAVAITEEGNIIPSTSVGTSNTFVRKADRVLIELNLNKPLALEGFHDIFEPEDPPYRKPIEIGSVGDRIGVPHIELSEEKLAGIVITELEDDIRLSPLEDKKSKKIAHNIIELLNKEVEEGKIPNNLFPLQSGVGKV